MTDVPLPMTAEETLSALRRWGVPFQEVYGWRARNSSTVGTWRAVHGVVIHDTAVTRSGAADPPGPPGGRAVQPLEQFACDDDGTVWLVGAGRVGDVDPTGLAGGAQGGPATTPPGWLGPNGPTDDDNFYGVTVSGRAGPPGARTRRSLTLLCAAVCHHHGWTASAVIAHWEWSNGSPDPARVDMRAFRSSVAHLLRDGPPRRRGTDREDADPARRRGDPLDWLRRAGARAVAGLRRQGSGRRRPGR